jgi:hypothetical protein
MTPIAGRKPQTSGSAHQVRLVSSDSGPSFGSPLHLLFRPYGF